METRLLVLAAGKGTRMISKLPKVLHKLAGNTLLGHVLDTGASLNPASITVVIGHGAQQVQDAISRPVNWAIQTEQLGTGHAVQQGLRGIEDEDVVLITYGDVPLTRASTFQSLLDVCHTQQIALLTVFLDDPAGYGRIVRANGVVVGVVEQKDATSEQLEINEINAGVLAINGGSLKRFLSEINNNNSQGEYYLTDIFAMAVAAGQTIAAVHPEDTWEADGVNSREQLAVLERVYQQTKAKEIMALGVTLRDPSRIDVRGELLVGMDSEIDVNCVFVGSCHIGSDVSIGANCTVIDSRIENGAVIHPNSVIENTLVGKNCSVGPFARLRPGTTLAESARIGNFVETKNSTIGKASKVNHLSYVDDADIGAAVNVGAGTITCNYDGANKHRTVLHDDVHIGSNTALVAPVTVHAGATIGAGSVISRDVPAEKLSFTRAERTDIDGWQRPVKKTVNKSKDA